MRTSNQFVNDSGFISDTFIKENSGLSIPYLIVLVISTVIGSIGNLMVIGSVITYKVRLIGNQDNIQEADNSFFNEYY